METLKKRSTLGRVLAMTGRYRLLFFLSLLFSAGGVVATLYIPILAGKSIDLIVGKGLVNFAELRGLLIQIAVCAGVGALLQWLVGIVNNHIAGRCLRDIRGAAFAKLQNLPVAFIDANPHGDIVSRITSDADQFADGLLLGFSQLFSGLVTIAATLAFMVSINWKITLAVVLLTPLSLLLARFFAKRTYGLFRKQSEARGEQTALMNEMVDNFDLVQAFSHEEKTMESFDGLAGRLEKASVKAVFYSAITMPGTRFINSVIYAVVGLLGAFSVISGGLTVGGLTGFLSYANQYTKPFNDISSVVTELQNALACAARLFELIDAPAETDSTDARGDETVRGDVELRDVCFSYTEDKKLIENFNLKVSAGQRVAIVGPTGCGKTTVINLLMRFYDVNSGEITIDSTNIQSLPRRTLRKYYGMVLQETWLKSGSVAENIKFGRPDATDEEMVAAAKAAHAHGFIKRLPDGYNTHIGEEGSSLSAGQRQLLCIARVMLVGPSLLILDEATSSIDTRTEMKVQDAFAKLMEGRTGFVVAHRLSTIQSADIILVMRDGQIVEKGSHTELLALGGFYKTLYESQFVRPDAENTAC